MPKYLYLFLPFLVASCGFFGDEKDLKWFKANISEIEAIKAEIGEIQGIRHVSGRKPWENNNFKHFDHEPTANEVERYNRLYKKLNNLKVLSASIDRMEGSFEIVTYDSGVFGEIFQSFNFIPEPSKAVVLSTPEVWACNKTKIEHWYVCEGVPQSKNT
ncbi:hypothetical protein [Microbulbifer agarilyticus]|uniref:hypothetical protein n=1 Tax=Microbulbifer agarilyticus TaxID=260552 RepID=UPI001CD4CB20|nr:hypothetical protein [Microbulbifer agarilyticus]MCA0895114.1 hypothetical protein [Microbulbifer agarilyticus]